MDIDCTALRRVKNCDSDRVHVSSWRSRKSVSLVVALHDVRMHVPVPAAEHHSEPGGGVPLGEHLIVRRIALDQEHSAAWLPDGYSKILRLQAFGPSASKNYGSAALHSKVCSLPFLGLRQGGGQILPSGNTVLRTRSEVLR